MGIGFNPNRADVDSIAYLSTVVTVGTSAVEAKVGGTALADRQKVILYNDSAATVYFGPAGVTTTGSTKGIPLTPGEMVTVPSEVGVYMIADTASNAVIVQELS